jgi:hypothetical protein
MKSKDTLDAFKRFFVSMELTVALLALSMILVFVATLDQVNLGIWAVQEKYFRTFVVITHVGGVPVPVFPGGYFIGGLLLCNLIAAHVYRFKLSWKKVGIHLTHFGLIFLLVGELITGLFQEDFQMRLDEGQTRNYSESFRENEVAIIDVTDPAWDEVVAIPEALLADKKPVQHPKLPFRVVTKAYYPNAALGMRNQVPNAPESTATQGIGPRLVVTPQAMTFKHDERNLPAALLEFVGPNGSLGTWLVSTMLIDPQQFTFEGRNYQISFRFKREYKGFALTLVDFTHDKYPGTEIPKNFSSRVRVKSQDGATDREVLIFMNNPLRYDGLTFYQAGFDNNDTTSVLQVVRNPGWLIPYVSCLLMTLGLTVHFLISLNGFIGRRSAPARTAA